MIITTFGGAAGAVRVTVRVRANAMRWRIMWNPGVGQYRRTAPRERAEPMRGRVRAWLWVASARSRGAVRPGRLLGGHLGAQLVHQRPEHVHVVLEHVAEEHVGHPVLQVRVLADEPAEAEPVVELAHQPPHPLHPGGERRLPLAELSLGRVALFPR